MKHTALVEEKIKEFKEEFIPIESGFIGTKAHGKYDKFPTSIECIDGFLRTFASAIRENDKEEFRGMIPKKRWVEDDNKYPDITWIKENYGKKQFNKAISELTTKLENF
jgi:hypothetical protein